jgi:hypothetical protein
MASESLKLVMNFEPSFIAFFSVMRRLHFSYGLYALCCYLLDHLDNQNIPTLFRVIYISKICIIQWINLLKKVQEI